MPANSKYCLLIYRFTDLTEEVASTVATVQYVLWVLALQMAEMAFLGSNPSLQGGSLTTLSITGGYITFL